MTQIVKRRHATTVKPHLLIGSHETTYETTLSCKTPGSFAFITYQNLDMRFTREIVKKRSVDVRLYTIL